MTSFENVIDHFRTKRVLVVGDIMLDRFVYGHVSRISPEAPAPVINTAAPEEVIGGAGNVARNIAALAAACDIVAVVGSDEAAHFIGHGVSLLRWRSGGLRTPPRYAALPLHAVTNFRP
jgi:D-beta-D-heptose 7-phosphate kinase/D-beta-D-heptose 1-phosphate adenosyltransferase